MRRREKKIFFFFFKQNIFVFMWMKCWRWVLIMWSKCRIKFYTRFMRVNSLTTFHSNKNKIIVPIKKLKREQFSLFCFSSEGSRSIWTRHSSVEFNSTLESWVEIDRRHSHKKKPEDKLFGNEYSVPNNISLFFFLGNVVGQFESVILV